MFDSDQYPGKPKILFVGNPYSSHVHGWVNLLTGGEFNIRLFACTDGCPPADWKVKTYIITTSVPEGLNAEWRESWWPEPEKWNVFNAGLEQAIKQVGEEEKKRAEILALHYERDEYHMHHPIGYRIRYLITHLFGKKKPTDFPKGVPYLPELPPVPPIMSSLPLGPVSKAPSPQEWLADVIRSWKPDIIHTIGLDEGTNFYAQTRKQFHLEACGKWVIKIFGGSDLAFKIFDPQILQDISRIFAEATHVILDNRYYANMLITKQVLEPEKICPLTPVPGSGGVDVDSLCSKWLDPTSHRRAILWPKSYETIWSKALPILFALRAVWDHLQPCELYMLATNSEMKQWISTLPRELRQNIHVFEGVPREMVLELMLKSRVVVAPSLIDGVPNVMYEAMACGALPILSPIPTIKAVVN